MKYSIVEVNYECVKHLRDVDNTKNLDLDDSKTSIQVVIDRESGKIVETGSSCFIMSSTRFEELLSIALSYVDIKNRIFSGIPEYTDMYFQ